MPAAKMRRGIDPELLAWLEKYGETSKPHKTPSVTRVDFHPQFGMERFLESHNCTEDKSGIVDGVLHVVVECCPLCGKEARESTVPAGVTKFIFGGYSYGFVCHACGINSKDELEDGLAELVDGFEPWDEFIYKDDDPEFLLSSFGAEKRAFKRTSRSLLRTCLRESFRSRTWAMRSVSSSALLAGSLGRRDRMALHTGMGSGKRTRPERLTGRCRLPCASSPKSFN